MFKKIIHVLYQPTHKSNFYPIIFRRTLRNVRIQTDLDSSQENSVTNQGINCEKTELENIEAKLFGLGESAVNEVPIKNDSLKLLRQERPVKLLKDSKSMLQGPDKKGQSKKHVKELSRIVKDTKLGLEYTKLKLNDPLLAKLILTAKSRKHRDKTNQIIVEGRRLILEALEARCRLRCVVFSQKDQLALIRDRLGPLEAEKLIKVPQQDLRVWSTLSTCPGVLAIFDRPDHRSVPIKAAALPITVVCDNIREPNNLGSIIRSCAALPCAQVIALKGCCDPWEAKALRGGCGGQFRVKIHYNLTWSDLDEQLPGSYNFFIAESNGAPSDAPGGPRTEPCGDLQLSDTHNVLVIGGETHGISDCAYEFLAQKGNEGARLHIPLAGGVESLNTAAAVTLILFEMRKLLLNSKSCIQIK